MDNKTPNVTGLIPPLQDKLKHLKRKISKILEQPKSERKRKWLKTLLKEARQLQKVLKSYKKQGISTCCPFCNSTFTTYSE